MWGHKRIKEYHWQEIPNWGDKLAPLLLERYAGIKTEWDTVSHARIVSVGSVLEHIPPLWDGIVLGTGKLYETSRLHLHTNTATVLGVRGPLTARQCPAGYEVLGDPGLLADELVPLPRKQYDLGLVPHWSDKTNMQNPAYYSSDWSTIVIDPADDPLVIIQNIGSCRKIVTSSLHGMIVADAFGIPRKFVWSPTMAAEGMFKFLDYSAAIKLPLKVGEVQEAYQPFIEDLKYGLYDAYRELGGLVR